MLMEFEALGIEGRATAQPQVVRERLPQEKLELENALLNSAVSLNSQKDSRAIRGAGSSGCHLFVLS